MDSAKNSTEMTTKLFSFTATKISGNAGIGRAAAVVSGYLHYVRDMPLDLVHYTIAKKRPTIYFDRPALQQCQNDFQQKFQRPSTLLKNTV